MSILLVFGLCAMAVFIVDSFVRKLERIVGDLESELGDSDDVL